MFNIWILQIHLPLKSQQHLPPFVEMHFSSDESEENKITVSQKSCTCRKNQFFRMMKNFTRDNFRLKN